MRYPRQSMLLTIAGIVAIVLTSAGPLAPVAAKAIPAALSATTVTVELKDVPLDAHRSAAQHLEEVRFSEMAPGWDVARLAPLVRPLYRPDIDGVAYYEFAVVVPPAAGAQAEVSAAATQPAGFIIVSTAEHDFPVAHWNFTGLPPTRQLEQEARLAGKAPVKFYKLDTLAYAAEDSQGLQAATLGQQPPKIDGMDPAWLDQPAQLSESRPVAPAPGAPISETGQLELGPPPPAALKLEPWQSWDALKAGYAESYAVLAEGLRREAHEDWEIDRLAGQFGQVLHKGDVYTLGLLDLPAPNVTFAGPGAQYIQTELLNDGRTASGLKITVVNSVVGHELPFEVTIAYGNGASELIKFMIVEPWRIHLPLLASGSTGATSAQAVAPSDLVEPISAWGAWVYYWAGTHPDQRLYGQMGEFEAPNDDDCLSGCGATAWAMLFGWADNQVANGNAYWAGRWGLYRQNGGTGADAVAPQDFALGVKNMVMKIRDWIATFCLANSGATFPWDMGQAQGYLNPRTTTVLGTTYNSLGIHEDALRDSARFNITRRHTPAILGTGWLNHYPLAYGYRRRHRQVKVNAGTYQYVDYEYRHEFYVNQGWQGNGNGWISAGTWFSGSIWPCLEKYISSDLGCVRPEPS